MSRSRRSSASSSNNTDGWLNWQKSVSDISMSSLDVALEYSESEDDWGVRSPTYATGKSTRLSREQSQSSRVVKWNTSDEESPSPKKKRRHEKEERRHHRVWNAVSSLAHSTSPAPKRKSVQSPPNHEESPLLLNSHHEEPKTTTLHPIMEDRAVTIAASFLTDCERGRRPSLPADLSQVTDTLLTLYRCKFSIAWELLLHLAGLALFVSSGLEVSNEQAAAALNVFAIVVFVIDMSMGSELRKHQVYMSGDPVLRLRHSRMELYTIPMMVMLLMLAMEMVLTVGMPTILWSGILKPIALFYISNQAKNALEALHKIGRIVTRVLLMELFLILCFATVACQVYASYNSFQNLSTAFLSLFQLSTTVVNPSVWMPMYSASRMSAIFFVLFVITSVFYLHSLVLSVVFQTYVQASADIHDRSMTDREDSIRLAFLALESIPSDTQEQVVHMNHVRKTLQLLRPHYNAMKINALVEIVDPSYQQVIDYPSFRTKIRQALNASIRSTRTASFFSIVVELVASIVAISNCVYVILLSSSFQAEWFEALVFPAGCVITVLGAFELVARFGHVKVFHFTPITRLNSTFDGLAAVAALISCQGIIHYCTGRNHALELLLVGRAIDMIRVMRFFDIFRDIVRRSSDVFPALAGPLALVVTSVHVFCYFGMALWGGAIKIGSYGSNIEPLYDLNNFNSYTEGLVAMFQVLVVNDWHAISAVFLYATRCSSPYIVYPFFIGANLICVSIMLNCLTAFFVGAFVTKLNDDVDAPGDVVTSTGDFSLRHSGQPVQRIQSQRNLKDVNEAVKDEEDEDATAISDEMYEFDVYEREGYDKIMRTVAGAQDNDDEFARQVCDVLEVFESLCPGRERVGYMVCCQQTLNRYGNRRFQTQARHYVHENALHMVVSDMHAELILFDSRERVLQREFRHLKGKDRKLEFSASLIRQQPAMTLFVSRIVQLPVV